MDWESQDDGPPALVQKTAKLLPAPKGEGKQARRSFFRVVADIWHAVRGYTADDIARLKEGGVLIIEGRGQTAVAEADAKTAEAAERHAKAEWNRAEAVKARAEAYATKKKADGDYARNKAEAFSTVVDAISRIKQQGGGVSFDLGQLERLLGQGREEFPNDKQIASAEVEPTPEKAG